eukprot:GHVU01115570.1.p1 GENE.GHVU01115570.1~~GHVU01115570.1.p1  ORF type:complete len:223 (-),score=25.06 GHVU01115570.1:148-816(-)
MRLLMTAILLTSLVAGEGASENRPNLFSVDSDDEEGLENLVMPEKSEKLGGDSDSSDDSDWTIVDEDEFDWKTVGRAELNDGKVENRKEYDGLNAANLLFNVNWWGKIQYLAPPVKLEGIEANIDKSKFDWAILFDNLFEILLNAQPSTELSKFKPIMAQFLRKYVPRDQRHTANRIDLKRNWTTYWYQDKDAFLSFFNEWVPISLEMIDAYRRSLSEPNKR